MNIKRNLTHTRTIDIELGYVIILSFIIGLVGIQYGICKNMKFYNDNAKTKIQTFSCLM